MLVLGIIAAGGVFAGTNPAYTQYELTHHFKTAAAKFVVTEPELLPAVLAAAKEYHIEQASIRIFNPINQAIPDGFSSWQTLMECGERDWVRFDDEKTSKSTTAARLFSSGTTGLPKAASLSHYNLIAQHTLVNETNRPPYEVRNPMFTAGPYLRLTIAILEKPSRLLYLPLFHAAMVPVAHVTPLRTGDHSYILRRFELEPMLSSLQKYQITDLALVPPVAVAVIKYPHIHKYFLKSVKVAHTGAGPLDKEHQNTLSRLLSPEASFTQVWGMTETSCVASKFYFPEKDDTGSVGRMMPNLDVK